MRQRKRCGEINDEIIPQISHGDFSRIHDEFSATEDSRIGGDESGARFHDHVKHIEEIRESTKDGDDVIQFLIGLKATRASDERKVQVKRIDEKSDETGDEEDAIPASDEVAVGIEDLIMP